MLGYDFDRQKPIDNFIVDFFCSELMLAIEIDGETHNYKISRDRERQKRLEGLGVWFLRFTDDEVKQNIEGVVEEIERSIKKSGQGYAGIQPTPSPLPRGDR
jgi:very-short-patch-repair endonuclease